MKSLRRYGTLIQSQWRNIFRHLDVPVTFYAAEHDGRAWQHLSFRLEVIHVPAGHGDCLNIGAELLVDHLQQRIDVLHGGASPSLNRTRHTPEAAVA